MLRHPLILINDEGVQFSGWNLPKPLVPGQEPETPLLPHDRLHWLLQRAPSGDWISSLDVRWRDLAEEDVIGPGCTVYRTRERCHTLYLGVSGSEVCYQLQAPEPAWFFGFDRYATRLSPSEEEPLWLYSVYGYLLSDQALCVRYHATQLMEYLLLPRPVQFPW